MGSASRALAVVILAAGQGTRMKSGTAKVLHDLAGRPMLGHALAAAEALDPAHRVVIVGRDAEAVEAALPGRARYVLQAEQRGTGHAVQQAAPLLEGFRGDVLILYGDVPLLRPETLRALVDHKTKTDADLVMLSTPLPLPGIVVRGQDGSVDRIVERTDAGPEELRIQEFNTGVYLVDAELLWKALAGLDDRNAQGELYLTDIVGNSVAEGRRVEVLCCDDPDEAQGVNTRAELARATAAMRRRIADRLMDEGVTLIDPDHTYVDVDVQVGRDSILEPGVMITGPSVLGSGVHIKAHSVIEASRIDDDVVIGPCAHLRPGNHIGTGVRIGNFVEVKNSNLGAGVKADHLSYIGDADVADRASFGCGSVVVNYDGTDKRRTQVGERAFVGCNVNLIAPVDVSGDSYVAAGSTITQDVPGEALAVARARQRNIEGWVRRKGTKVQRAASKETGGEDDNDAS